MPNHRSGTAPDSVVGMPHGIQISFDAANPPALAEFWAIALGYVEQPPPEGFESWADFAEKNGMPLESMNNYGAVVDPENIGPRLFFQKVPEGKTAKNRVHLDIDVTGHGADSDALEAHIEILVSAGASRYDKRSEQGVTWVVMSDPEGNEFCVS